MINKLDRQSGGVAAKLRRPGAAPPIMAAAILVCLCAAPMLRGALAQGITLSDEIIFDRQTGAALLGFDPVAYFVQQKAIPGHARYQAQHSGKVWYFESEANRAAFIRSPESYFPAFGGHDPVAIAAGFAVSGSPRIFVLSEDRVYFFRKDEARDAFLREPAIAATATRNWPQVKRDMVP